MKRVSGPRTLQLIADQCRLEHLEQRTAADAMTMLRPGSIAWYESALELRVPCSITRRAVNTRGGRCKTTFLSTSARDRERICDRTHARPCEHVTDPRSRPRDRLVLDEDARAAPHRLCEILRCEHAIDRFSRDDARHDEIDRCASHVELARIRMLVNRVAKDPRARALDANDRTFVEHREPIVFGRSRIR